MNKKLLVLVVVLAAVGLGVYLILSPGKPMLPEEKSGDGKPVVTNEPELPGGGKVQVDIKGFSFIGKATTINAGTTILWKNLDAAPHTVTSDTGLFDSKTLLQGQTYSLTFNTPGRYKYHCSIHPNITGEIVVK